MPLATFFKLIRWKNLLFIIYAQLLIKYLFFKSYNISTNLSSIQFFVFLVAVILIAGAGYIINDIQDLKTDLINKPKEVVISKNISIEKAKQLYLILNTAGIASGLGLCLNIQKPSYAFIFIGTSLLLYYYSKKLKAKPFVGNFVVSILIAVSMLLLGLIDIDKNFQQHPQRLVVLVLSFLACFAFFLNLIREIVKDIEDVNGDHSLNMKTLPILFGRNRIKKITSFICILPIALLLFIILNYSQEYKYTTLYLLLFSLIPTLYVAVNLLSAKSVKDYKRLSLVLKIIMFLGLNSLTVLSINS